MNLLTNKNILKSKITKPIFALFAFGLVLGMTGCTLSKPDKLDTDEKTSSSTTTTNTQDIDNDVNPDTETGTKTDSDNGLENEKTEKYSDLLNSVLTSDTYNAYLDALKHKYIDCEHAFFNPNPYAFYTSRGYDVNAITNSELEASTKAFVLENEPNNLYMITYCADNTNTYFNEFMLRYTLTNDEMADYKMMHEKSYIQAVFMNDAISASRTPEILIETKCLISTHKALQNALNSLTYTKKMFGPYSGTNILLKEYDEEEHTFTVYIYENLGWGSKKKMTSVGKFGTYYLRRGYIRVSENNGIFDSPFDNYGSFKLDSKFNVEEPEKNTIDATWYYSEYAKLSLETDSMPK